MVQEVDRHAMTLMQTPSHYEILQRCPLQGAWL